MSDNPVIEKLSLIGQELDAFERLAKNAKYYSIINAYIPRLTLEEVEAALALAVKIKQSTIRSTEPAPISAHVSQEAETNIPLQPSKKRGHSQRVKITDDDRQKVERLRQLGYTPKEISKLVSAESESWAKNIIYCNSSTSRKTELVNLRHLDLGNLPFPPTKPKLVKRQLQQSTSRQRSSSNRAESTETSTSSDADEPA